MLTFDDYKAKISIIQILEDLGYKQDISKGKVSPVFKLTDGAGNKLDEIIIKNPHSVQEHYYDRNYKGGDLIQFIKNHINDFPQFQHQNTFVRINMILFGRPAVSVEIRSCACAHPVPIVDIAIAIITR